MGTHFLSSDVENHVLATRTLGTEQNMFDTSKRERWRQHNVNMAFSDLRRLLPTHPPDKKLSKLDVLRASIKYIKFLDSVLKKMDGLQGERGDKHDIEVIDSNKSKKKGVFENFSIDEGSISASSDSSGFLEQKQVFIPQ